MPTEASISSEPIASRRRIMLAMAALVLVALGAYANSIINGYVFDDVTIILQNPLVKHDAGPAEIFSSPYTTADATQRSHYRPLTILTLVWDRALWGEGPMGIHVINVLMNAALAPLACWLLIRLRAPLGIAFLASLLWIVHPTHTEVVANGIGRAELGAALFILLAGHAHVSAMRCGPHAAQLWTNLAAPPERLAMLRRSLWYALAMGLYFIGLFFKESAAVLPGLLFMAEWLLLREGAVRPMIRRVPLYLLYAIPLGVHLVIRFAVVDEVVRDLAYTAQPDGLAYRYGSAIGTLTAYLAQQLVPLQLCADYIDFRVVGRPVAEDPWAIAGLIVWPVLLIIAGWLLVRRRSLVIPFGLAWFGVAILPVSNLIIEIGNIRGDRFMFVPSLGIMLILALGLYRLIRASKWTGVTLAMLIASLFTAGTIHRNADWRTEAALLQSTIECNPGAAFAYARLADLQSEAGDLERAIGHHERALELLGRAGRPATPQRFNYATTLQSAGRKADAESAYRAVLEAEPDHLRALVNLAALLYERDGRERDAEALLARAAELPDADHRVLASLAQVRLYLGDAAGALDAAQKAARLARESSAPGPERTGIARLLQRCREAVEKAESGD